MEYAQGSRATKACPKMSDPFLSMDNRIFMDRMKRFKKASGYSAEPRSHVRGDQMKRESGQSEQRVKESDSSHERPTCCPRVETDAVKLPRINGNGMLVNNQGMDSDEERLNKVCRLGAEKARTTLMPPRVLGRRSLAGNQSRELSLGLESSRRRLLAMLTSSEERRKYAQMGYRISSNGMLITTGHDQTPHSICGSDVSSKDFMDALETTSSEALDVDNESNGGTEQSSDECDMRNRRDVIVCSYSESGASGDERSGPGVGVNISCFDDFETYGAPSCQSVQRYQSRSCSRGSSEADSYTRENTAPFRNQMLSSGDDTVDRRFEKSQKLSCHHDQSRACHGQGQRYLMGHLQDASNSRSHGRGGDIENESAREGYGNFGNSVGTFSAYDSLSLTQDIRLTGLDGDPNIPNCLDGAQNFDHSSNQLENAYDGSCGSDGIFPPKKSSLLYSVRWRKDNFSDQLSHICGVSTRRRNNGGLCYHSVQTCEQLMDTLPEEEASWEINDNKENQPIETDSSRKFSSVVHDKGEDTSDSCCDLKQQEGVAQEIRDIRVNEPVENNVEITEVFSVIHNQGHDLSHSFCDQEQENCVTLGKIAEQESSVEDNVIRTHESSTFTNGNGVTMEREPGWEDQEKVTLKERHEECHPKHSEETSNHAASRPGARISVVTESEHHFDKGDILHKTTNSPEDQGEIQHTCTWDKCSISDAHMADKSEIVRSTREKVDLGISASRSLSQNVCDTGTDIDSANIEAYSHTHEEVNVTVPESQSSDTEVYVAIAEIRTSDTEINGREPGLNTRLTEIKDAEAELHASQTEINVSKSELHSKDTDSKNAVESEPEISDTGINVTESRSQLSDPKIKVLSAEQHSSNTGTNVTKTNSHNVSDSETDATRADEYIKSDTDHLHRGHVLSPKDTDTAEAGGQYQRSRDTNRDGSNDWRETNTPISGGKHSMAYVVEQWKRGRYQWSEKHDGSDGRRSSVGDFDIGHDGGRNEKSDMWLDEHDKCLKDIEDGIDQLCANGGSDAQYEDVRNEQNIDEIYGEKEEGVFEQNDVSKCEQINHRSYERDTNLRNERMNSKECEQDDVERYGHRGYMSCSHDHKEKYSVIQVESDTAEEFHCERYEQDKVGIRDRNTKRKSKLDDGEIHQRKNEHDNSGIYEQYNVGQYEYKLRKDTTNTLQGYSLTSSECYGQELVRTPDANGQSKTPDDGESLAPTRRSKSRTSDSTDEEDEVDITRHDNVMQEKLLLIEGNDKNVKRFMKKTAMKMYFLKHLRQYLHTTLRHTKRGIQRRRHQRNKNQLKNKRTAYFNKLSHLKDCVNTKANSFVKHIVGCRSGHVRNSILKSQEIDIERVCPYLLSAVEFCVKMRGAFSTLIFNNAVKYSERKVDNNLRGNWSKGKRKRTRCGKRDGGHCNRKAVTGEVVRSTVKHVSQKNMRKCDRKALKMLRSRGLAIAGSCEGDAPNKAKSSDGDPQSRAESYDGDALSRTESHDADAPNTAESYEGEALYRKDSSFHMSQATATAHYRVTPAKLYDYYDIHIGNKEDDNVHRYNHTDDEHATLDVQTARTQADPQRRKENYNIHKDTSFAVEDATPDVWTARIQADPLRNISEKCLNFEEAGRNFNSPCTDVTESVELVVEEKQVEEEDPMEILQKIHKKVLTRMFMNISGKIECSDRKAGLPCGGVTDKKENVVSFNNPNNASSMPDFVFGTGQSTRKNPRGDNSNPDEKNPLFQCFVTGSSINVTAKPKVQINRYRPILTHTGTERARAMQCRKIPNRNYTNGNPAAQGPTMLPNGQGRGQTMKPVAKKESKTSRAVDKINTEDYPESKHNKRNTSSTIPNSIHRQQCDNTNTSPTVPAKSMVSDGKPHQRDTVDPVEKPLKQSQTKRLHSTATSNTTRRQPWNKNTPSTTKSNKATHVGKSLHTVTRSPVRKSGSQLQQNGNKQKQTVSAPGVRAKSTSSSSLKHSNAPRSNFKHVTTRARNLGKQNQYDGNNRNEPVTCLKDRKEKVPKHKNINVSHTNRQNKVSNQESKKNSAKVSFSEIPGSDKNSQTSEENVTDTRLTAWELSDILPNRLSPHFFMDSSDDSEDIEEDHAHTCPNWDSEESKAKSMTTRTALHGQESEGCDDISEHGTGAEDQKTNADTSHCAEQEHVDDENHKEKKADIAPEYEQTEENSWDTTSCNADCTTEASCEQSCLSTKPEESSEEKIVDASGKPLASEEDFTRGHDFYAIDMLTDDRSALMDTTLNNDFLQAMETLTDPDLMGQTRDLYQEYDQEDMRQSPEAILSETCNSRHKPAAQMVTDLNFIEHDEVVDQEFDHEDIINCPAVLENASYNCQNEPATQSSHSPFDKITDSVSSVLEENKNIRRQEHTDRNSRSSEASEDLEVCSGKENAYRNSMSSEDEGDESEEHAYRNSVSKEYKRVCSRQRHAERNSVAGDAMTCQRVCSGQEQSDRDGPSTKHSRDFSTRHKENPNPPISDFASTENKASWSVSYEVPKTVKRKVAVSRSRRNKQAVSPVSKKNTRLQKDVKDTSSKSRFAEFVAELEADNDLYSAVSDNDAESQEMSEPAKLLLTDDSPCQRMESPTGLNADEVGTSGTATNKEVPVVRPKSKTKQPNKPPISETKQSYGTLKTKALAKVKNVLCKVKAENGWVHEQSRVPKDSHSQTVENGKCGESSMPRKRKRNQSSHQNNVQSTLKVTRRKGGNENKNNSIPVSDTENSDANIETRTERMGYDGSTNCVIDRIRWSCASPLRQADCGRNPHSAVPSVRTAVKTRTRDRSRIPIRKHASPRHKRREGSKDVAKHDAVKAETVAESTRIDCSTDGHTSDSGKLSGRRPLAERLKKYQVSCMRRNGRPEAKHQVKEEDVDKSEIKKNEQVSISNNNRNNKYLTTDSSKKITTVVHIGRDNPVEENAAESSQRSSISVRSSPTRSLHPPSEKRQSGSRDRKVSSIPRRQHQDRLPVNHEETIDGNICDTSNTCGQKGNKNSTAQRKRSVEGTAPSPSPSNTQLASKQAMSKSTTQNAIPGRRLALKADGETDTTQTHFSQCPQQPASNIVKDSSQKNADADSNGETNHNLLAKCELFSPSPYATSVGSQSHIKVDTPKSATLKPDCDSHHESKSDENSSERTGEILTVTPSSGVFQQDYGSCLMTIPDVHTNPSDSEVNTCGPVVEEGLASDHNTSEHTDQSNSIPFRGFTEHIDGSEEADYVKDHHSLSQADQSEKRELVPGHNFSEQIDEEETIDTSPLQNFPEHSGHEEERNTSAHRNYVGHTQKEKERKLGDHVLGEHSPFQNFIENTNLEEERNISFDQNSLEHTDQEEERKPSPDQNFLKHTELSEESEMSSAKNFTERTGQPDERETRPGENSSKSSETSANTTSTPDHNYLHLIHKKVKSLRRNGETYTQKEMDEVRESLVEDRDTAALSEQQLSKNNSRLARSFDYEEDFEIQKDSELKVTPSPETIAVCEPQYVNRGAGNANLKTLETPLTSSVHASSVGQASRRKAETTLRNPVVTVSPKMMSEKAQRPNDPVNERFCLTSGESPSAISTTEKVYSIESDDRIAEIPLPKKDSQQSRLLTPPYFRKGSLTFALPKGGFHDDFVKSTSPSTESSEHGSDGNCSINIYHQDQQIVGSGMTDNQSPEQLALQKDKDCNNFLKIVTPSTESSEQDSPRGLYYPDQHTVDLEPTAIESHRQLAEAADENQNDADSKCAFVLSSTASCGFNTNVLTSETSVSKSTADECIFAEHKAVNNSGHFPKLTKDENVDNTVHFPKITPETAGRLVTQSEENKNSDTCARKKAKKSRFSNRDSVTKSAGSETTFPITPSLPEIKREAKTKSRADSATSNMEARGHKCYKDSVMKSTDTETTFPMTPSLPEIKREAKTKAGVDSETCTMEARGHKCYKDSVTKSTDTESFPVTPSHPEIKKEAKTKTRLDSKTCNTTEAKQRGRHSSLGTQDGVSPPNRADAVECGQTAQSEDKSHDKRHSGLPRPVRSKLVEMASESSALPPLSSKQSGLPHRPKFKRYY